MPEVYREIEAVAVAKMEDGEGVDHDLYWVEQEWRDREGVDLFSGFFQRISNRVFAKHLDDLEELN
jgi:hypothetical protein